MRDEGGDPFPYAIAALVEQALEVIELVPPYVQTHLMGARQASDPGAMPLADFIAESVNILETSPDVREICVERVKPLRFADANGGYDAFFKTFNIGKLPRRNSGT